MRSLVVVPWAELLQQPTKAVAHLAEVAMLRLRRRDADDLVLMTAKRADQEGVVIDLTVRLLARLVTRDAAIIDEVMPDVLPWSRFLTDEDLQKFTEEFISMAQASVSVGNLAPLSQLLIEWQHTAEVFADPELHRALTKTPLEDFGPVPRPED